MSNSDSISGDHDVSGGDPASAERTFTQEEVDKIVAERLKRAKPADYDDLRAKADEFDRLAESSKSAEQRAAEAEQAAERRAAEAEARAVRYEVAAEHGISKTDADLFLIGADADTIAAQAERLNALRAEPRSNNYVPGEGKNSDVAGNGDELAFANFLTGRA